MAERNDGRKTERSLVASEVGGTVIPQAEQSLSLTSQRMPGDMRQALTPQQLAEMRQLLIEACLKGDLRAIEGALPVVQTIDLNRYGAAQRGDTSAIVDASLCIAIVGAFHRSKIPEKTVEDLHTQVFISGRWDEELAGSAAASAFAWGVLAGGQQGEWNKIQMRIENTTRDIQAAPLLQAIWLAGLGSDKSTREQITDYLLKIAAVHSKQYNERHPRLEGPTTSSGRELMPISEREIRAYISSPSPSDRSLQRASDTEINLHGIERFATRLIRFNPAISQGLEEWFRRYGNSPLRREEHGGSGAVDFLGAHAPKLREIASTPNESALVKLGKAPDELGRYLAGQALRILRVQQVAIAWTDHEIERRMEETRPADSWFSPEYFHR